MGRAEHLLESRDWFCNEGGDQLCQPCVSAKADVSRPWWSSSVRSDEPLTLSWEAEPVGAPGYARVRGVQNMAGWRAYAFRSIGLVQYGVAWLANAGRT